MARRKRARSSSSSGREISTCLGGRIHGTKRKSNGNESRRANERTNGVLNIAASIFLDDGEDDDCMKNLTNVDRFPTYKSIFRSVYIYGLICMYNIHVKSKSWHEFAENPMDYGRMKG